MTLINGANVELAELTIRVRAKPTVDLDPTSTPRPAATDGGSRAADAYTQATDGDSLELP